MKHYSGRWIVAIVAFALLGAAGSASAQPAGPVTSVLRGAGIYGGINRAIMTGSPADADWLPAFMLGVFLTPKPDTITWQVEAGYHGKGSRVLTVGTFRSHYFEVPLMLRLNLLADRRNRFHLLAGGSIGMKFRATLESPSGTVDLSDAGTRFEIGVVGGAGVDLHRLLIEVRATQGLTRTGVLLSDTPTRNRSVALILGWRLSGSTR